MLFPDGFKVIGDSGWDGVEHKCYGSFGTIDMCRDIFFLMLTQHGEGEWHLLYFAFYTC